MTGRSRNPNTDVETERAFHNERAQSETKSTDRLSFAYASVADVLNTPTDRMGDKRKSVLEVGCYLGDNSSFVGKNCHYIGIDISDVAIQRASQQYSGPNRIFRCLDANNLEALGSKFDYVFGNGVLHHLDLEAFANGLAHVLGDNGEAVFVEPMVGPFWLRAFRALTPSLRTVDEHPLKIHDFATLEKYFSVQVQFHAFARPLMPMIALNNKFATALAKSIDERLMRTKFGRTNAWLAVINLRPKPKSRSQQTHLETS